MLDPNLSVLCVYIIDVHMETWVGVDTAGHTFAYEGSTEPTLLAWWHGHPSDNIADNVSLWFFIRAALCPWVSWAGWRNMVECQDLESKV